MWRIREYAVYDTHGGLTKYFTFQSFLSALERENLSIDSPDVSIYCTKVGVLIADCYGS